MGKFLTLLAVLVVLVAPPALAMNVDDILELCRAGFEPDRIAQIVATTGLDRPLEASEWVRIKNEGCGQEVVDELLSALMAVEGEAEGVYESDENDDVDVSVYGAWGTDGWYGSMFWGSNAPSYHFGWYDPYWYTSSWYWYDPWYCNSYAYRSPYYCNYWSSPYYYCDGYYTGGYYYDGYYGREKASRQGGTSKAYRYASTKASPEVAEATYSTAKAKPYRGRTVATGSVATGATGYRKSSRTAVTTADGPTVVKSKTTRSTTGVSTGAVKSGSGSTTRTYGGYAKSKTRVTHGGVSTGSGSSSTATRSTTKTKTSTGTTGTSTTVKRKSSGATSTGQPSTGGGAKYHAPSSHRAPSMSAPRSTATPRSSGTPSGGPRAKGRH